MQLTTAQLARACHLFLKLAYPDGPASIPPKKRTYFALPVDRPVAEFLPPAPAAQEVGHLLPAEGGGVRGYALRLGSCRFPHLKLKCQLVDYNRTTTWIFTVDTHDAFSKESVRPPPDHPDAPAWCALQEANSKLKEQIERAFDSEGLMTFNGLLRGDLEKKP